MKISVIVPVYNSELYISDCIESIIGQTHKELEIILVDDGSTDRAGAICDEYAARDHRISVIHQSNAGVSGARNMGLRRATGEWISFIDSDDTLDSDMYELLLQLAKEYDADIVHCGYKHIVGKEIRLVHDTRKIIQQKTEDALKCLVGGHLFVGSLWNKLYKRELTDNLQFRTDLKINEDILFNFELFRKAKVSVFADYAKYNYIAHLDSSSCFITPDEKKLLDACEVNRHIFTTLKGSPLESVAGERYIRSLSGYYRLCQKNDKDSAKKIANEMWKISQESSMTGKNMRITVYLVHYCPSLYRLVYSIYDCIRKPNWEV